MFVCIHCKEQSLEHLTITPFLLRSGTDFEWEGLARSLRFSSSQRYRWGWGQGSVWTNQIIPYQTHPTMSLCTLLCESGHSRAGIEKGFPQTVHTKLEN